MPEENELQKLKKEYPDFFQKTSPELIDFIFSEKTSSRIANICVENNVTDSKKIDEIAYRITLVLLGRLPKENLVIALEYGTGLPAETAQKISSEVNRLIFSAAPKLQSESGIKKPAPEAGAQQPPKPDEKDVYREQIT